MSLSIGNKRLVRVTAFSGALVLIIGINPIQAWANYYHQALPMLATRKLDSITYANKHEVYSLLFKAQDLVFDIQAIEYPIDDLNIVVEKEKEILIELAADVLFDFDKANLKPSAIKSLQGVAKRIRESSRGDVRIEGHTDSKGSNEYNQTLSEKRAISVRDWFVSEGGLSNVQFATKGLGELKPVVSNTTEEGADDPIGRQRNRRVEIIIKTGD
ncbi:Bacterial outer membrane protein [Prochlorococcus marinus str. MIT 9313]|uniref:Bacterial outer membrane protein n=1 Tax=Prochlorococcus marinus (strain MIT 9313) TaxID=74547 RepID=Q7V744_PROMM|nr:OmpA family protein [Prochlorococcus marinus]CAE21090.1 Bacterial outer membrane protein [Prochlorococcus marinus str. MIT 9313]